MHMLTRRRMLSGSAFALAMGLQEPLVWSGDAKAQEARAESQGFNRYMVGDVEVTALYDGIWKKEHDPAFIKNASVEETKVALAKAGQTTDYVPIPLTVIVLKIGDRRVMIDSGSGQGQWQPTATRLAESMKAAGIAAESISTILVSHFHPDHIYGLMEKGTDAAIYPNAEIVVHAAEWKWWMEPGRVESLPQARKALGARIQRVFPGWKNFRLAEQDTEVAPGVRLVSAPGHTPGHAAYHLTSGAAQLMISNDVAYVPALLAPHPEWQGAYDQDGPTAVTTRRALLDRVIAEKMSICGAHFPFPGAGTFVKDGAGYVFTPTI